MIVRVGEYAEVHALRSRTIPLWPFRIAPRWLEARGSVLSMTTSKKIGMCLLPEQPVEIIPPIVAAGDGSNYDSCVRFT